MLPFLQSLLGAIAVGPRAEKQPKIVLLCPMYGCLKECCRFLDTLGSRGTDERNQYVLPRLYEFGYDKHLYIHTTIQTPCPA